MREDRLVFAHGITLDTANHMRNRVADVLARPDVTSLTILFSSEGGSTDQALSLYNFLTSMPKPIHMHAVGHVGSVANTIFLAGHKRTSSPHARFFFHEYDWGFDGRQTIRRMNEAVHRLTDDIEMARKLLRARAKPDESLLKALDGSGPPVVLSPTQALEMGLVEEIVDLPQAVNGEPQIVVWV